MRQNEAVYVKKGGYVLVEEWNDWRDYIMTTDYTILAISDDVDKLREYRNKIIETEFKDDLRDYKYNDDEYKFEFNDAELHFDIIEVENIK